MAHHNLAKADWTDRERIERMVASYSIRYDKPFWDSLLRLTGITSKKTIADFGCGPGLFLIDAATRYSAKKIIGLDESPGMLECARGFIEERSSVEKFELIQINFDLDKIPLDLRSVELAFCGFMLHEVRDPRSFVKQVVDTLESNGAYAIYDYISGNESAFVKAMVDRGMEADRALMRYPHMCKHSVDDIINFMKTAGLSDIQSTGVNDIRAVVIGKK